MPDYASVIESAKAVDGVLLLMVVLCGAVTVATLRIHHSRFATDSGTQVTYWYHRPMLYLPRPPLPSLSLGWIIAIGLLLRLPLLGGSLWNDEAVTARLMELPIEMFPGAILSDTHPFAYYFFLRGWTTLFGTSPIMLRLPSVLFSLWCIHWFYLIARKLNLSHAAGLGVAALVATLPASILYSTEARSYMLLTALVMYGVLAILDRDPNAFGFSLMMILWTHNIGILYVLALIYAAVVYNKEDIHRWRMPAAFGTALGLLWLPFLIHQIGMVADGFWTYFSVGMIARAFFLMTVGSINAVFVIPLTVITVISLWKLRTWLNAVAGRVWLALVTIPVVLVVIISLLFQPIFTFRHLLPAVIIFIIIWGYMMSRSRVALAVTLPVIALSLITFFTSGIHSARPDYRGLIAQYCSGADSFYATSINSAFITLANDDRPTLTWRGAVDNGLVFTQDSLPQFGIETGSLADLQGQTVCIMQIERPETSEGERLMIAFLQERYPVESAVVHLGTYNDLVFHIVEV